MAGGFLPRTDGALLAWSMNFRNLIQSTPAAFGLTPELAANYSALHDAFATALAACEPAIRSRVATAAKNAARDNLKNDARFLSIKVQGNASVTAAQKILLGLTVRRAPTPIPPPSDAPGLSVKSVSAWTVQIRLRDAVSSTNRGKPAGAIGASVFSYVGAAPPADLRSWRFEGNTGKLLYSVNFPSTLAPGTRVWLTAFWFNDRKQSGPACDAVPTNLAGGSVALAA